MANTISGPGFFSGIGNFTAAVVSAFNLLITRIIGYTTVLTSGGSSYYTTTVGVSSPAFVGFANDKKASYSTDGINWVIGPEVPNPTFDTWFIGYGDNKYVGLSSNGFTTYSVDGLNWHDSTSELSPVSFMHAPIYANGIWVAISSNGLTAYSVDGINWTVSTYDLGSQWLYKIAYGNGKFVTFDYNGNSAYSSDGITWTLGAGLGANSGGSKTHPVYVGDRFIVFVGATGTRYSTDGISWSAGGALPSDTWGTPPAYGNSEWMAISVNGTIVRSTDGINWTTMSVSGGGTDWYSSPVYADGMWVAIPYSGNTLWYKPAENNSWLQSTVVQTASWNYSPIYQNGKFVAVAEGGQTMYGISRNDAYGIDWVAGSQAGNPLTSFTFAAINSLVETQVSIGDQGTVGAEVLAPVDVYTVPAGMNAAISQVTIKNNSADTITYDLWILESGVVLSDLNQTQADQSIAAGVTTTVNVNGAYYQPAGTRIVVLPSAVDVVEVKVYGTESLNNFNFSLSSPFAKVRNDPGGRVYIRIYEPLLAELLAQDPSPITGNRWIGKNITFSNLTTNQPGKDISLLNNTWPISYSGYNDHYGDGNEFAITIESYLDMGSVFELTGGTFTVNL